MKEFNATDAKSLTQGYWAAKEGQAKAIVDEVVQAIEKAARSGKEVLTYGPHPEHHSMIAEVLANRGFKTRCQSDQRDGDYIEIVWRT